MDIDICNVLGENIKRLRKIKNITQAELAESLGMEVKSLSLIETGKGFVSAKTLEKIIKFLNVSPTELFETPDKNNSERLYSEIITYLEHIKNDNRKLNTVNLVIKSLV